MDNKSIEDILEELKKMPGVICAIAAMNNGIKLTESVNHNDQDNKIAAMLAAALGSGKEAMKEAAKLQDQVDQIRVTVEAENLLWIIIPAGEKALLGMLFNKRCIYEEDSMPGVAMSLAAQKIADIVK